MARLHFFTFLRLLRVNVLTLIPDYKTGMNRMETRVSALENFATETRDRLVRMETRMGIFFDTYATKADLHKELHAMTWKLLGGASALVGIVYWVVRQSA